MRTPVRVSFKSRPQHTSWDALLEVWREADRLGVYGAGWVFDHFTPIFAEPGPQFEAWTLLTALGAGTERIRVGVMVSSITHRHPSLLAKMAATVDHITGGRLELGLGAGWDEDEHRQFGLRFPAARERLDRLEEACELLDALLRGETVTRAGGHYPVDGAVLNPAPVQHPRPPIIVGGRGEKRTLRIAARYADRWNISYATPEVLEHKVAVLRRHAEDVGRDPSDIDVTIEVRAHGRSPEEVAEDGASLVAAGAQHLVIWYADPFDLSALSAVPEALVDAGLDPIEGWSGLAPATR
jgi:F420-dependent oxidoreductase-like protein